MAWISNLGFEACLIWKADPTWHEVNFYHSRRKRQLDYQASTRVMRAGQGDGQVVVM